MIYLDASKGLSGGIGRYIKMLLSHTDIYDYCIGDEKQLSKVYPADKIISPVAFKQEVIPKLSADDIVHFPGNDMTDLQVEKKLPCKVYLTIHDATPLKVSVYDRENTRRWRENVKKAVANADVILTDSENSKKDIMECFHVADEKIEVTYLAVDSIFEKRQLTAEDKKKMITEYGILYHENILLSGGSNLKNKNLFRLLRGFIRSKSFSRSTLLLISSSKKLQMLLRLPVINRHIKIVGRIDDEELVRLYNYADVFMFVSLYEGFGLPPLEAMKCSTAVISSNCSCIPEILGDAAYLINPYSVREIAGAIDKVLENKDDLRSKMCEKADRQVLQYDISAMRERYEEVFLKN